MGRYVDVCEAQGTYIHGESLWDTKQSSEKDSMQIYVVDPQLNLYFWESIKVGTLWQAADKNIGD